MTSMEGGSLAVTPEVDWSVLQPLVNQSSADQKLMISAILLRRSDQKTITLMTDKESPHHSMDQDRDPHHSMDQDFWGPEIPMKRGILAFDRLDPNEEDTRLSVKPYLKIIVSTFEEDSGSEDSGSEDSEVDTRKASMEVEMRPIYSFMSGGYGESCGGDTWQMACALKEAIWED
jgi:hypothetical protein